MDRSNLGLIKIDKGNWKSCVIIASNLDLIKIEKVNCKSCVIDGITLNSL